MSGAERPKQSFRLPQGVAKVFNNIRRRPKPAEQPREETTEEDRTWAAYMGKKRDWRELAALVGDPETQPIFQQRAIECMNVY